ncbi:hypothetical protein [Mycoplasma procyoni]|uniref:hypothetical protein n=1 Tax=Mycoplasma procyoni TaxID=568784 RepID=UPI00197BFB74|nr:hypothetical protein [Mycoplasma procyoni]MBN3534827.1 hypothetical protein [Mycoplasma procyoni]
MKKSKLWLLLSTGSVATVLSATTAISCQQAAKSPATGGEEKPNTPPADNQGGNQQQDPSKQTPPSNDRQDQRDSNEDQFKNEAILSEQEEKNLFKDLKDLRSVLREQRLTSLTPAQLALAFESLKNIGQRAKNFVVKEEDKTKIFETTKRVVKGSKSLFSDISSFAKSNEKQIEQIEKSYKKSASNHEKEDKDDEKDANNAGKDNSSKEQKSKDVLAILKDANNVLPVTLTTTAIMASASYALWAVSTENKNVYLHAGRTFLASYHALSAANAAVSGAIKLLEDGKISVKDFVKFFKESIKAAKAIARSFKHPEFQTSKISETLQGFKDKIVNAIKKKK